MFFEIFVVSIFFLTIVYTVVQSQNLNLYHLMGMVGFCLALLATKWFVFDTTTLSKVQTLEQLSTELPRLQRDDEYISSNQCRACHQGEYESWHQTYHRTMTQVALPDNVAGEFDGSTVYSNGLQYRVYRNDDEFWAEMPDPEEMMYVVQGGKPTPLEDIPRVHRRVTMTTGSHHYQTYWVAGADRYGRLQQTLPLIYLMKDNQWIPREEAFMMPPKSTRMITQWNDHCIKCHSTGGNPALQTTTQEGWFDTEVGELGISCEACHGPGQTHSETYRSPLQRYRAHLTSQEADHTIVNPETLDHRRSSQICGQCHGVFIHGETGMKYAKEGIQYRPGEDIHEKRYYIFYPQEDSPESRWEELRNNPEFFRERWWDDGTMLAGGREYTAMAVSGCYTKGEISCLSCHSMHNSDPVDQLKDGMRGNRACTQCHSDPKYTDQIETHTHHKPESTGSECMNCHMPHTTYALFSGIRNHQIQSPAIARSIKHGTPNACNLCHLDQTLAWSQDAMKKWYDHEPLPLTEEQQTVSAALLWLLKGHAAQRVIAAWHVGWKPAQETSGTDWLAPFQARLLDDPYGVVRYVAEHNLKNLPGFEHFAYNYLAPTEELLQEEQRIIQLWEQNQTAISSHTGSHVLIDSEGRLMEGKIQQLLSERDNRPVTIKE